MMTSKYKIQHLLLATLILIFFSCNEDYRLHNMVDDQIYAESSGFVNADIHLLDNSIYLFHVVKSGMGLQEAEVEIQIDEQLLAAYNSKKNSSYKLLPSDFYTIKSKKITFGKDDYNKSFEIQFKKDKVEQIISDEYVLPLSLKISNSSVAPDDKERLSSIVSFKVKKAYLEFDENYMDLTVNELSLLGVSFDLKSADQQQVFTNIKTNYPNSSELSFQLEVDPKAVEEYNKKHGTSFILLPNDAFSFDKKQWNILPNLTYNPIEIKIQKDKLFKDNEAMYGKYLLPIRITSVSKYGTNPDQDLWLIPVTFKLQELNRSKWEVIDYNSCIIDEPQYATTGRGTDKLLDGNAVTYWGSKWDVPLPFPYYFVFDMKEDHKIIEMGITKPTVTWRGNVKAGYFEVSSDNIKWTKVKEWVIEDNAAREHKYKIEPRVTARYIKLVITDAFVYKGLGAQMDIAEFNVWGE